jgi:murein L,D-transpeptidase YcbB/YkuD
MPVLFASWTVNVGGDDHVSFRQDIYGQDAVILQALEEREGTGK